MRDEWRDEAVAQKKEIKETCSDLRSPKTARRQSPELEENFPGFTNVRFSRAPYIGFILRPVCLMPVYECRVSDSIQ